jgi:hypothetical protein
MPVIVKIHARRANVFAMVVDMPASNILVVQTPDGETVKVHESLIRKYL